MIKEFISFAASKGNGSEIFEQFKAYKADGASEMLRSLEDAGAETGLIRELGLDTAPALGKLVLMKEEDISLPVVLKKLKNDETALAAFKFYAETDGTVPDGDGGQLYAFTEFCDGNPEFDVEGQTCAFLFADEAERVRKARKKAGALLPGNIWEGLRGILDGLNMLAAFESATGHIFPNRSGNKAGNVQNTDKKTVQEAVVKFLSEYGAYIGLMESLCLGYGVFPADLQNAGIAENPAFTGAFRDDFAHAKAFDRFVDGGLYSAGDLLEKLGSERFAGRFKDYSECFYFRSRKFGPSSDELFAAILNCRITPDILLIGDDPVEVFSKLKDDIGISDSDINELVAGELAEEAA